jgi:hypothetical protein
MVIRTGNVEATLDAGCADADIAHVPRVIAADKRDRGRREIGLGDVSVTMKIMAVSRVEGRSAR